jgi:hypothetical protein
VRRANRVGVNPKTSGFYREDAARLALEAAARAAQSGQAPAAAKKQIPVPTATPAPTIELDEPARAPLRPEPAINQNEPPAQRPRALSRAFARVLITPLYIIVGLLSLAVIGIFVKDLLGL